MTCYFRYIIILCFLTITTGLIQREFFVSCSQSGFTATNESTLQSYQFFTFSSSTLSVKISWLSVFEISSPGLISLTATLVCTSLHRHSIEFSKFQRKVADLVLRMLSRSTNISLVSSLELILEFSDSNGLVRSFFVIRTNNFLSEECWRGDVLSL